MQYTKRNNCQKSSTNYIVVRKAKNCQKSATNDNVVRKAEGLSEIFNKLYCSTQSGIIVRNLQQAILQYAKRNNCQKSSTNYIVVRKAKNCQKSPTNYNVVRKAEELSEIFNKLYCSTQSGIIVRNLQQTILYVVRKAE